MPSIPLVLVLLASTVVCRPRDLLTGPDFLAVFMRSRAPSTDHYYDHNDVLTRADQYESFKLADIRFDKEFPTEEAAETTTSTTVSFTTTEMMEEGTTTATTTTAEEEEEEEGEGRTEQPSAVVSVRVSSSVVRSRPVLGVQDQPTVTAVQRSHLGVDEGSRAVSFTAPDKPAGYETRDKTLGYTAPDKVGGFTAPEKTVSYSEEHTVYRVEGRRVPDSVAEASQEYGTEERAKGGEKEYRAVTSYRPEDDPQKSPVSYRTSVSSATSGSRVQFYREPPAYARTPYPVEKPSEGPKNYEEPEKVYGQPERNYEVDEAVSVGSDGRAHGVQEQEKAAKFGYVVEGRKFRKYRVEERTADGFIVGEYGVVSHDDGSLRGVRYTADSNISPRLIYDALVKFLSLK